MDSLESDLFKIQIYLQQILEVEISIMSDILYAYRNSKKEEFISPANTEKEKLQELVSSLRKLRKERLLLTKLFIFFSSRIYSAKPSSDNILEEADLKTFSNLVDIYMLKDQLMTLIEQINFERIFYKKSEAESYENQKQEIFPAKKKLLTYEE